ncbi:MAG TPA: abortive infection family protein [Balneolaceae bacterium]
MEKLKNLLQEYGRWQGLSIYVERIEAHIESDFSHSLENAKALLESIGKEICKIRGAELNSTASINSILRNAFSSLGYTNSDLVNQISSALATIGQQVGNLRNEIGATSHGRSLEEIRERNNKVDALTKEFLIDSVEIVSAFLIRSIENENPRIPSTTLMGTLEYTSCEDFNESWDESFGEFSMGDYSYPASEVLFHVDNQAYATEYNGFKETLGDNTMKIIALRGKSNIGKTTTIRNLYDIMLSDGFAQEPGSFGGRTDIYDIVTKNNVLIGITSSGDTEDVLNSRLEMFNERECGIVICACRTRGGTNEILDEYSDDINFIEKKIAEDGTQEELNREDAELLLETVNELV